MDDNDNETTKTPEKKARRSSIEADIIVDSVFDMLMDGVPQRKVADILMDTYNIGINMAYRYIKKARNRHRKISQTLSEATYARKQKRVLEEMWMIYETMAETPKEKRECLQAYDKIARGEVDPEKAKLPPSLRGKDKGDLLKLIRDDKKK